MRNWKWNATLLSFVTLAACEFSGQVRQDPPIAYCGTVSSSGPMGCMAPPPETIHSANISVSYREDSETLEIEQSWTTQSYPIAALQEDTVNVAGLSIPYEAACDFLAPNHPVHCPSVADFYLEVNKQDSEIPETMNVQMTEEGFPLNPFSFPFPKTLQVTPTWTGSAYASDLNLQFVNPLQNGDQIFVSLYRGLDFEPLLLKFDVDATFIATSVITIPAKNLAGADPLNSRLQVIVSRNQAFAAILPAGTTDTVAQVNMSRTSVPLPLPMN